MLLHYDAHPLWGRSLKGYSFGVFFEIIMKTINKILTIILTIIKQSFVALFCEKKNGGNKKEFSTKKMWALILVFMAVANKIELSINGLDHWVVVLSQHGVSDAVIISMIASLDALAAWALAVYSNAKSKGAA